MLGYVELLRPTRFLLSQVVLTVFVTLTSTPSVRTLFSVQRQLAFHSTCPLSFARFCTMHGNRRALEGTLPSVKPKLKIGGQFHPTTEADFIPYRCRLWDSLYESQQEALKKKVGKCIEVQWLDRKLKGIQFQTTPYDIAKQVLDKKKIEECIVAKVQWAQYTDNEEVVACGMGDYDEVEDDKVARSGNAWTVWDFHRPLEGDCLLQFLTFDDPEGQTVFWHSSAHILGEALESKWGAHLTVGPPLTQGFYYDCYMGEKSVDEESYASLTALADKICKEKQTFQRLVCTKEEALQLFKHNPFKLELIQTKVPDGSKTSCYRCGPLIDLCRGPHVPHTAKIGAFKIVKHSSSYWLGDKQLDTLQRIYGISFPDKKRLTQHVTRIEQAKKRDHRVVGPKLGFFFFDSNASAGSCFWLPHGSIVYNNLCEFMRKEYRIRGFKEVITPSIYSCDVWKTSGHHQNYKENMYLFSVEDQEWGLKPMNCPGHCIMFKHMVPSYKQLPIRLADFSALHRNELSGSLSGLTRVRRFEQDDGHIFCTMDQIQAEITAALEFLDFVYNELGFTYDIKLSTRPAKAMGSTEIWDEAEEALRRALDSFGKKWELNPGDGAFYGPKIDIILWDALQRPHQCGTIQLDFLLPERFNLQYRTSEGVVTTDTSNAKQNTEIQSSSDILQKRQDMAEAVEDVDQSEKTKCISTEPQIGGRLRPGMARPVIIHRAIFGSLERMFAVLLEHSAGKLPFWLSPRQLIVLPISEKSRAYAKDVYNQLLQAGYHAEIDETENTFNKKIREAQLLQCNVMLVVGELETQKKTVTVRFRDQAKQVEWTMEELLHTMESWRMPRSDTSYSRM